MGLLPLRAHLRLPGLLGWIVHEPFLIDFLPIGVAEGPSRRAIADPDGAFLIGGSLARLRVDAKHAKIRGKDLEALRSGGTGGRLGAGCHEQGAKHGNYDPKGVWCSWLE